MGSFWAFYTKINYTHAINEKIGVKPDSLALKMKAEKLMFFIEVSVYLEG